MNVLCRALEIILSTLKGGYSRVAQINAFDVRSNRLSTSEAKKLSEKYDGRKPPSLEIFLEYMGLSEEEFNKIVKGMAIPPYDHDFDAKGDAPRVWDFDQWYREDNRKK